MVNSKKKGNRFELSVSKWFTKWSGYKFERVPCSGAWHSNRDATSDITCVDPSHQHACKISVECKSYKEIKFEHVILGNKGSDINKFWEQATRDAKRSGKIPVLCMRYNAMPRDEFFFVVSAYLAPAFWKIINLPYLTLNFEGEVLMVFMASNVIKQVSYKEFHTLAKENLKHNKV
jgi:hypothetical protein